MRISLVTLGVLASEGDTEALRVLRLGFVSAYVTPTKQVVYPSSEYNAPRARRAYREAIGMGAHRPLF